MRILFFMLSFFNLLQYKAQEPYTMINIKIIPHPNSTVKTAILPRQVYIHDNEKLSYNKHSMTASYVKRDTYNGGKYSLKIITGKDTMVVQFQVKTFFALVKGLVKKFDNENGERMFGLVTKFDLLIPFKKGLFEINEFEQKEDKLSQKYFVIPKTYKW